MMLKNKVILFFSLLLFSINTNASQSDWSHFDEIVLSKNITPDCDLFQGSERGTFSIEFKNEKGNHLFLVLTGVYNDTCKNLNNKIKNLKKKYQHLRLSGTRSYENDSKDFASVWRWESIKSPDNKICVSYFLNDCE